MIDPLVLLVSLIGYGCFPPAPDFADNADLHWTGKGEGTPVFRDPEAIRIKNSTQRTD